MGTHPKKSISIYQVQGGGGDLPGALKDIATVLVDTIAVTTDTLTETSGGSTGSVTILRLLPSKDATSGVLETILP